MSEKKIKYGAESKKKDRAKPLQVDKGKIVKRRVRKIKNIAEARSLLSLVIEQFQRDEVNEDYSRTIGYLLNQYANLWKVEKLTDFEERLEALEEIANGKN